MLDSNYFKPWKVAFLQTANTVIIITPNVFKNEVVKEASGAQVVRRLKVADKRWINTVYDQVVTKV